MANKRLYYAVKQAGFSICGENTFTTVRGLQSIGMTTNFNLEQIFEIGQVELYENSENIPDIEVTLEKVLDGEPLVYHLATKGATSPTLSGRSNIRSTMGLSIYTDTQDAASGTPLKQCTVSGLYVSSVAYRFQVNGPSTESVTLVGNNKVWNNTFTATAFHSGTPHSPAAPEGVNKRQHLIFGSAGCKLPTDIPGISASGTNELSAGEFGAHIQSISVQTNLGREQLFELGRRGPYHRYVSFPVEVRCDIEVLSTLGDNMTGLEDDEQNLTDQEIYLTTQDTTTIDLGTKCKLASVTFGGGNAGQGGGNDTEQWSYTTFNEMTVTHDEDPSGL